MPWLRNNFQAPVKQQPDANLPAPTTATGNFGMSNVGYFSAPTNFIPPANNGLWPFDYSGAVGFFRPSTPELPGVLSTRCGVDDGHGKAVQTQPFYQSMMPLLDALVVSMGWAPPPVGSGYTSLGRKQVVAQPVQMYLPSLPKVLS
jgi:hypothetical protein